MRVRSALSLLLDRLLVRGAHGSAPPRVAFAVGRRSPGGHTVSSFAKATRRPCNLPSRTFRKAVCPPHGGRNPEKRRVNPASFPPGPLCSHRQGFAPCPPLGPAVLQILQRVLGIWIFPARAKYVLGFCLPALCKCFHVAFFESCLRSYSMPLWGTYKSVRLVSLGFYR